MNILINKCYSLVVGAISPHMSGAVDQESYVESEDESKMRHEESRDQRFVPEIARDPRRQERRQYSYQDPIISEFKFN